MERKFVNEVAGELELAAFKGKKNIYMYKREMVRMKFCQMLKSLPSFPIQLLSSSRFEAHLKYSSKKKLLEIKLKSESSHFPNVS